MTVQPSKKWALLIGIDSYKQGSCVRYDIKGNPIHFRDLEGCVGDVLQVEQYLLQAMKVEQTHITKLLAPQSNRNPTFQNSSADMPTYSNIVNALKVLTSAAKRGDLVYIHYSGHGARATTVFPTLKGKDELDEALVPADIMQGGHYLRDLEFALLLKRMEQKGLIVTVVLDSCHSGSATRGPRKSMARGMEHIDQSTPGDIPTSLDEILQNTPMGNTRGNSSISREIKKSWLLEPRGYTLFAACLPHEAATEYEPNNDGQIHGALTHWLLDTLRCSTAATSTQSLYRRVCAKFRDEYLSQTPILGGESDRLFFSASTIPTVFSLTVRKVGENPVVGDKLKLDAGSLHGVCEEAEYAIFEFADSKPGRMGPSLARVKITKVSLQKSTAELIQINTTGGGKLETGCRAVLLNRPADQKFLVGLPTLEASRVEEFRKTWQRVVGHKAWLRLASKDDQGHPSFFVSITDDGRYEIQNSSRVPLINLAPLLPQPLAESSTAVHKVLGRIRHLGQYNMVKMLENNDHTSTLRGKFLFEVIGKSNGRDTLPSPIQESGGIFNINDQEWIMLRFTNLEQFPVYVVLFDLKPLFGISQIYPEKSPFEVVDPGQHRDLKFRMDIPKRLLSSIGDTQSVLDTLKFFVTIEPLSLQTLILPDIDRAEKINFSDASRSSDSLQNVLDSLVRPRRDARSAQAVDQWQTLDITVCTSRKN